MANARVSTTSTLPSTPSHASFLPKLAFSTSSIDLSSESDITPNSETTTLNERHDSLEASPRSSISLDSARKTESKRVRFQESVAWSYFDVETQHNNVPSPAPESKPSWWSRLKSRNSSGDLHVMSKRNASTGGLSKVTTSASSRPVLSRRSSSTSSWASNSSYTIQQPLRESAGRRYDAADTQASWRRGAATAKGSWDDLLSNPRQSRLYA